MALTLSGSNGITGPNEASMVKAWVNFNQSSINDDGNVSSVTDNGTGDFTINFSNGFSNVYYAISFGLDENGYNDSAAYTGKAITWSTGSTRVGTQYTNRFGDGRTDFNPSSCTFVGD